jgi:replicative DNA helicase
MTSNIAKYLNEEDIVKALVQNREKIATFIDELKSDYFNSNDLRIIFKVIKTYFIKYKNPPKKNITISLINALANSKTPPTANTYQLVETLYETYEFTDDELEYIHDQIIIFIKTRMYRDVMIEGINKIDDPESFEEINDKLRQAVLWRMEENFGTDIMKVGERYAKQKELLKDYIPFPWPDLNKVIGGGLFPKTLSTFAAASSVGKSIALDQTAFYVWSQLKKNVVVISLELSEEIKGLRIDAQFTGLKIEELVKNEDKVIEAYKSLEVDDKKLIIKEYPASSINTIKISHFISRLEMYTGFQPDFIIIDYADLILPNSMKRTGLYQDGGEVFEQLRGLAYEYKVPVLTATQLGRTAIELPPDEVNESHISESQKKMNTCDNIIGIIATSTMRAMGQATFKTLKARNGIKDMILPKTISYSNFKFS